jgi:hypothetical protein
MLLLLFQKQKLNTMKPFIIAVTNGLPILAQSKVTAYGKNGKSRSNNRYGEIRR